MRRIAAFLSALPVLATAALAAPADDAHGGDSVGLPQLDTSTYVSQIFWLLVTFLILYALCARVFLPRIGGIIEERRNRIADDFDQAAEFKRQAEEAEAAYRQALADAKARAAQIAAETRAQIDAQIAEMQADVDRELDADVAAAEARIRETGAAAAVAVKEAARDTTQALVAALIDDTPSDAEVDAALAKVGG